MWGLKTLGMTDSSPELSVTGHGGKFGVSAPASLHISGTRALLTGRDGETESVDLTRAGASVLGTCITIEDTHTLIAFSTRDAGVIAQVRADCPLELLDQIEQAAASLRKSNWSGWKLVVSSILLVGIIGFVLYRGIVGIAGMAVHQLPVEVDHAIGEAAHRSLLRHETVVSNQQVNRAMQQILDSLRPHITLAGIEPTMVVVESDQVNAYCLPGGYITVNTALLLAAQSPDEVAGILSHEIAHATLRHGLKQLTQTLTLVTAVQMLVGDVSGVLALGVEGAEFLIRQGYSRDHEREADLEGLRMMMAAGWDPEALASFFEKLEHESEGVSPPAWFSTHPDPGQRASTIRQWASQESSSGQRPPEIDWPALQAAVGE